MTPTIADQLLDAHVAYILNRLDTVSREDVSSALVYLLKIADNVTLESAFARDLVDDVVSEILTKVPGSAGAGEFLEATVDLLLAGPPDAVSLEELFDRDQLEKLLDEFLAHTELLERTLGQITNGPLVGALAGRFIGRIVNEVISTNQAVADKIPGLGSLVAFGTNTAAKVVGAADKQFEALLGGTANRGATFAVQKLNTIVVDLLRDPKTRAAILEVWDQVAAQPIDGLEAAFDRKELLQIAESIRSCVTTPIATPQVVTFAQAFVHAVYDRYGHLPLGELLDDIEVDRQLLVDHVHRLVKSLFAAAIATGEVEALIRGHLEPFYSSAKVTQILNQ